MFFDLALLKSIGNLMEILPEYLFRQPLVTGNGTGDLLVYVSGHQVSLVSQMLSPVSRPVRDRLCRLQQPNPVLTPKVQISLISILVKKDITICCQSRAEGDDDDIVCTALPVQELPEL